MDVKMCPLPSSWTFAAGAGHREPTGVPRPRATSGAVTAACTRAPALRGPPARRGDGPPAGAEFGKWGSMQISAKADYAVRALVELAADGGRPLTCEAIASAQDIPFRFLKSVFRELRQAGLVRSQRGCEGGYWLGRAAAAITVAEVVTAVDGSLLTLRGGVLDDLDYPGAARRLPGLWRSVEAAVAGVLGGVTLADLAGEHGGREPGEPVPHKAAGAELPGVRETTAGASA